MADCTENTDGIPGLATHLRAGPDDLFDHNAGPDAALGRLRAEREAQGFPPKVEDLAVLARVAAIVHNARTAGAADADRSDVDEWLEGQAAATDKESRWGLIAAIAEDAVAAGVPITGGESQVATTRALEEVGLEMTSGTIKHLTVAAKFDWESMPEQRQVWRRYGWSVVQVLAAAGYSPSAAAEFLDVPDLRTQAEVRAEVRLLGKSTDQDDPPELNGAWADWLTRAHKLLVDGLRLDQRTEDENPDLDMEAGFAQVIYQRMNERNFDTQLRQVLDGGEVPSP